MLTPEQKQRILTATGHSVWPYQEFDLPRSFFLCRNDVSLGQGFYPTELAAWDSWEPDANWCFREALPHLLKKGLYEFSLNGPYDEGWDACFTFRQKRLNDDSNIHPYSYEDINGRGESIELAICTAFDTYLLERNPNDRNR